jgi:hypothetical protein
LGAFLGASVYRSGFYLYNINQIEALFDAPKRTTSLQGIEKHIVCDECGAACSAQVSHIFASEYHLNHCNLSINSPFG